MITQPDAIQPWDRRPSETTRAFEMFTKYRDKGAQRSIRDLANESSTPVALLGRWSGEHDWVDRAAAWDAELDRIRQLEAKEGVRVMQRNHIALASHMLQKSSERIMLIESRTLTVREAIALAELGTRLDRMARHEQVASSARDAEGAAARAEIRGLSSAALMRILSDRPDLIDWASEFDDAIRESGVEIP